MPSHQTNWQRGFTLLEMMLVLALIALTVTFATLKLGGNQARFAEHEAKRLARVLDMIRDQSIITGQMFAIEVDQDNASYRFMLRTNSEWQTITDDPLFKLHELPTGLSMKLSDFPSIIEGQDYPMIVINSSGEVSPFVMTIVPSSKNIQWIVKSATDITVTSSQYEQE